MGSFNDLIRPTDLLNNYLFQRGAILSNSLFKVKLDWDEKTGQLGFLQVLLGNRHSPITSPKQSFTLLPNRSVLVRWERCVLLSFFCGKLTVARAKEAIQSLPCPSLPLLHSYNNYKTSHTPDSSFFASILFSWLIFTKCRPVMKNTLRKPAEGLCRMECAQLKPPCQLPVHRTHKANP